jgi:DNA-binding NtrC family response regulator
MTSTLSHQAPERTEPDRKGDDRRGPDSDDRGGPDSRDSLAGRVIVVLEDDDLIRRATERMLRRFGAEVVRGASSREVLDALAGQNLTPNCVIADYWLNRQEDGLAAAAAVCGASAAPVHGLIITGDGSAEIAAKVDEAGFRLLRKPVNVDSFLDALLRNS